MVIRRNYNSFNWRFERKRTPTITNIFIKLNEKVKKKTEKKLKNIIYILSYDRLSSCSHQDE